MKENLRTDTYRTEVYKYFLYSDIYKIGVNYRVVHLPKVNCESARHVREESNEVARQATQTGVETVSDCCYIQFQLTLVIAFATFMKFIKVPLR